MSDKNDPMTMNITIHPELQTELDQQISHSEGQLTPRLLSPGISRLA